MQRFILKVKRAETPAYRAMRAIAWFWLQSGSVPVPKAMLGPLGFLYRLHFGTLSALRRAGMFFYGEPLFKSRCAKVGNNLVLSGMPYVAGHTEISIGDNATIGRHLMVFSGRFMEHPRLLIGNGVSIGTLCRFSVNQEVVIEDEVTIGEGCRISDNDGHPRSAAERAHGQATLAATDIRPVRIESGARIGEGCRIMKGAQIGPCAVIGPNSVVMNKLPAHCFAAGNPAEVLIPDLRIKKAAKGGGPA